MSLEAMLGAKDCRPDRIQVDADDTRCRRDGALLGVALLGPGHVPQFHGDPIDPGRGL